MARGQIEFGDNTVAEREQLDDALAAMGIVVEDAVELDEDEYWLWPENQEVFEIWLAIQTQWNVGMAGATGLHYPGVETCMRMRGVKKRAQRDTFLLIQMMERACLEEWARQRKN